jgi:predicted AlkP superfamily pyrophosphatase or phosphodiesterase
MVNSYMKCIIALAASALGAALVSAQVPARDRYVVVISIDGLPASALDDPKLPAPTLRRLAAGGAVARGMRPINPTVTWPNHTAMVTGVDASVHQVLFNGMLVRSTSAAPPRVEPWADKARMVHATTVYDLAFRAGLTTAQVDWVAITNPGTITWEFAERPALKGAVEREMIAAGEAEESDISGFFATSGAWRDQMWTRAAAFITRRHKPNLGLYHLLNLDSIHHTYGPGTAAGFTGIALADSRVAEIVDAAKAAGTFDRTTFFIVSDHGFKTVKHSIRAAVAVKQAGIEGVTVIPEGGTALAYINDPAQRQALAPRLKEVLAKIDGVAHVYEPAEYGPLGLPVPAGSDQSPDLVAAARDTYGFAGGSEGAVVTEQAQGGSHGYLASDPEMNALFIACGRGIRPGTKLEMVRNLDLAPTIAALLGLKMEGAAGRPLDAVLQ